MCIYFRMLVQLPGVFQSKFLIPTHWGSVQIWGTPRRESKGKNLTSLCVGSSMRGDGEGVQGISNTPQKHTPHSKILIQQPKTWNVWSSECRRSQGLVLRRRFPIAGEEFQRQRKREESFLKYSEIYFLAIIILLLTFYLDWLLVPCFGF